MDFVSTVSRLAATMPSKSYLISLFWLGFCGFVHVFSSFAWVEVVPQMSKVMSLYDRHEWYNRTVALLHAAIMFLRTVTYWYAINPKMSMDQPLDAFGAMTLDIMMGYLWYDLLVEMAKNRKQPTTLIHHVIGYISLWAVRASNSGLGLFYFMLVFIAEGSTPVLHVLWLLKKLKLSDWWVFSALAWLLLFTFFTYRVVLGPYTLWHMVAYRDGWKGDPNRHWLFGLLFGIAVVFVIINFYWFFLLYKMAMANAADKKGKNDDAKSSVSGSDDDKNVKSKGGKKLQ